MTKPRCRVARTPASRRHVLASAAGGLAVVGTSALPAPAVAQAPQVTWRLRSGFDRARDAIRLPVEAMQESIATLTDDRFKVEAVGGDPIAPTEALAELAAGHVDLLHIDPQALVGEDPLFGLAGGAPFGLNARMQRAWLSDRRGLAVLNAALRSRDVVLFRGGSVGAAMGGWFRKPVTETPGYRGLKVAINGLGARVFETMGAEPVAVAPHAMNATLSAGDVDGAVWASPYDDENERLYQAARHLHYPGWWNGAGQLFFLASASRLETLPSAYRAALSTAAAAADGQVQARYDAQNAAALRRAVASGASLEPYSEALMEQCFAASRDTLAGIAATNPRFREILESMNDMRRDGYLWFQLAENTYDTFLMIQQRKDAL